LHGLRHETASMSQAADADIKVVSAARLDSTTERFA
jgi:hypothetical protein